MIVPNIVERLKQRKKMVEDESTLDEGKGLVKAKEKEQQYEGYPTEGRYPSDKEVERPLRKSEGGRYHDIDAIGIDVDAPPRKEYVKKNKKKFESK